MRRVAVAFGLILLIGAYAAPVIRSGGYSGWMIAVVACLLCPALACAVAGRLHVAFGLLTNLAIVASFFIRDRWLEQRGYPLGLGAGLVATGIALILSVPVSVGIAIAQGMDDAGAPPTGRCASCGYDLRASPDRCPECGATAPAAAGRAGGRLS